MATKICWRCMSPASERTSSSIPTRNTALFSTSTPLPRAAAPTVPVRGVRATFIKKKKVHGDEDKSRRPGAGERKAMRKRIVLSNTNALQVQGMPDFTGAVLGNDEFKGQVLGLPNPIVDSLRAVEAFKPTQTWELFRRPGMLVRKETLEIGKRMEEVRRIGRLMRQVLIGEKGSGKSLLALQAMAIGFLKGWTVINIPEAQELTIGHTTYAPLPSTSLFTQKAYIASLLSAIPQANPHLERLTLSQQPSDLPVPLPSDSEISLSRLASLGASDPDIAQPIFSLLISELVLPASSLPPEQRRPPLLVSMDGLAHALKAETAYRTAAFKPIHALDLAVVDFFMGFMSGKNSMPNGGLVLGVTSTSNTIKNPSLELALAHLGSQSKHEGPQLAVPEPDHHMSVSFNGNPFMAYDPRVLSIFHNNNPGKVEVQEVKGLSKEEAKGLMEYWARSGLVRDVVNDRFVGEKWTLSGGGVIGEMERGVLGGRI